MDDAEVVALFDNSCKQLLAPRSSTLVLLLSWSLGYMEIRGRCPHSAGTEVDLHVPTVKTCN